MRSLSTTNSSSSSGTPGPSGLARQNSTSLTGKPGALPANLDDMKVGGCPLPTRGLEPLPAWPPIGSVWVLVFRESTSPGPIALEGKAELQTQVSSSRGTWNLLQGLPGPGQP